MNISNGSQNQNIVDFLDIFQDSKSPTAVIPTNTKEENVKVSGLKDTGHYGTYVKILFVMTKM